MTREEAITYLNVIWNRYKAEYEIERETLDAYHMAIEALSTDTVSREVYEKRTQADEEIIDSYREMLANCHKEILRLLDFNDAIERQNDVIEVVRCKDCRHGQYDATHYFCAEHYHKVYEDDYCSYGERKKDANTD